MSTLFGPFYLTGWGLGSTSTGQVKAYLISNNPSNQLVINQTGTNSTGANLQACFTYDGSKTPAGLLVYVNGSSVATTTASNTLTGTIVSSTIGLGIIY